jgi:hypothetical protein
MESFSSVRVTMMPTSSRSGKNTSTSVMPASAMRRPHFRGQRLVGFEQHFAGLAVHQFAYGDGAFQISHADFVPA